ncbi:MAG: HAMP domain-containing protein [Candidatus Latescibacteria bacterium]|nr:HAMP domain-containing protein [Candidatus Latescibacterota bacterium]
MWFRNLRLSAKQLIGFGCILAIMVGVHGYSIREMNRIKGAIDQVAHNWMPRSVAIADLNLSTAGLRGNQLEHAFTSSAVEKDERAQSMNDLILRIEANRADYDTLRATAQEMGLYSERERQLNERFEEKWDRYLELFFEFYSLSRDHQQEEALALLKGESHEVFRDISAALKALVEVNKEESAQAAAWAADTFDQTRRVTNILLLATVLLSVVIAGGLVRVITVPVQHLEQAAGRVAEGHLDVQLEAVTRDEIGNLASSFNRMTTFLRQARDKTRQQEEVLRAQQEELRQTNAELAENARFLESQKAEIEGKNRELEETMYQLRTAQEQLVMKEKMAALGDLVAGITHEVNSPLGAVHSATDVSGRCLDKIDRVLATASASIGEQVQRPMQVLRTNINVTRQAENRLATLMKSLKNFARLDEAEFQAVDLHEGIDSSLTLLESELKGRVEVVRQYGRLPLLLCYPGQLNQAFINILRNASQAIDQEGIITVRTDVLSGRVQVQIIDTGRGIPPDQLERIFEVGFSAGGSRVKMASGLSTVYNIVQRHGGEVSVESQLGQGTTVTVQLPLQAA